MSKLSVTPGRGLAQGHRGKAHTPAALPLESGLSTFLLEVLFHVCPIGPSVRALPSHRSDQLGARGSGRAGTQETGRGPWGTRSSFLTPQWPRHTPGVSSAQWATTESEDAEREDEKREQASRHRAAE